MAPGSLWKSQMTSPVERIMHDVMGEHEQTTKLAIGWENGGIHLMVLDSVGRAPNLPPGV